MKILVSAFLILSSLSSFAAESMIITSTVDGKVTIGFSDSSFDYPNGATSFEKNFCYTGSVYDVCNQIGAAAFKMNADYTGGAHDNITIKSCHVVQDMDSDGYHPAFGSERVVTSYNLGDDYGSDINVTRTIEKCTRAR